MTILDSRQRFKDAERAGIVDKEGKAKKKSNFETMGKAMKRRNEFLYKPSNMAKDKVMSGALAFINELVGKGYLIAYVTARPYTVHEQTINQLEDKNFPIFKSDSEQILVFSKDKIGQATANYKVDKLESLAAQYDVRMFFDDDTKNLAAVASSPVLDIPGIYSSIKEYRQYQSRSNPMEYIVREGSEEDEESDDPSGYSFYGFTGDVDYEDANRRTNPSVAETFAEMKAERDARRMGKKGKTKFSSEEYSWSNPPVKPRRKKMKNGKYRKEPAKKYIDRFMGNAKMGQEFPDRGQRYAVALNYVEKYYGKRGLDSVGARRNPEEYSANYMVPRDIHRLGKAADRLEETYEDGQEVPEWWKSKLSVAAKDTDTLADSLEYVDERGNPPNTLPIFTGTPTSQFTNKGMISSEVQIGRNFVKDIGEAVQSIYKGLVGGRTTMAEKRMAMAIASMQKELSDRAKKLGGNAVANLKVDYEMIDQSVTLTLIATADAIKMRSPPKKNPPKKNPGNSKKIEKGKKLYKHMNGKEPEKIEKKKIDMGDVWYQVGEGGCWQIGYMSGKETGNSGQKYTHTFNEETQDGNFPKLYATMPENGKPLLIIQGGTWKIKTDDQGVAWIYD